MYDEVYCVIFFLSVNIYICFDIFFIHLIMSFLPSLLFIYRYRFRCLQFLNYVLYICLYKKQGNKIINFEILIGPLHLQLSSFRDSLVWRSYRDTSMEKRPLFDVYSQSVLKRQKHIQYFYR